MKYRVEYGFFDKLRSVSAKNGIFEINDVAFTDAVVATLACASEDEDALAALVADVTAGTGELLARETRPVAVLRETPPVAGS
jgi:hypothetical protein